MGLRNILSFRKITILLIVLILSLSLTSCWFIPKDSGEDLAKIQSNMEQYLKNMYQKEFVVQKPKLTGNEGFGYHIYQADSSQKDNKNVKFIVVWDKREPDKYQDEYMENLWTYQGKSEVERLLKGVYGQEVIFRFELSTNYERLIKNINELRTLSYTDMLRKHSDYFEYTISCYFFTNDPVEKRTEAQKAFKFYKEYIVSNNIINRYFLTCIYLTEDLKSKFMNEIESNSLKYNQTDLHSKNKLINILRVNRMDKNNSIDDVLKRFEY